MSKTNIPAGGRPVAKPKAAGTAFGLPGRSRRTKTEAGRMGPARREKYEPSQYHSRRLPCNRSGAGGPLPGTAAAN